MSEWRRYLLTDPTAFGKLYTAFEQKWMFVAPILLAWKVIILAPSVFIERNSFQQLLGISVAQACFGLFMFISEPSVYPLVDIGYKLAAAHQLGFLGLVSLNTRQRYLGQGTLDNVLVGLTAAYFCTCAVLMLTFSVYPTVRDSLRQAKMKQILLDMGITFSETTGLFAAPPASVQCRDPAPDEATTSSKRLVEAV